MRALTHWVLSVFTNPFAILALAALDSTPFFWLPFGIDAATILFAMRGVAPWWVVALLATAGSVIGSFLTFWIGAKVGDAGLERLVAEKRLESTRRRIKNATHTAALATLSLIPPPFPFTPMVLVAGALDVRRVTFFATLAGCRFMRFATEAFLARRFGPKTLDWLESPLLQNFVLGLLAIGAMLTTMTLIRLLRAPRNTSRRAAA